MRRLFRSIMGGMLVAVLVQSPAMMAAASAPAMGVILQAQQASVDSVSAITGSTVFDGDLLQTDGKGMLRVRFGSSQAYLFNGASAVVHQSPNGFAANLDRGEAVLSSISGERFSLLADGATIQPSTSQPTVAQVTWVSPKELLLTSRKGALQVSLDGDVKTVPDGASYRMVIDPAAAAAGSSAPGSAPQNFGGKNKFWFLLPLTAAALITVGVILALESNASPAPPTGLSGSTN